MPASPELSEQGWASVKLRRPLAAWLKREAARRGIFMNELVEELAAQALGGRTPWRRATR